MVKLNRVENTPIEHIYNNYLKSLILCNKLKSEIQESKLSNFRQHTSKVLSFTIQTQIKDITFKHHVYVTQHFLLPRYGKLIHNKTKKSLFIYDLEKIETSIKCFMEQEIKCHKN